MRRHWIATPLVLALAACASAPPPRASAPATPATGTARAAVANLAAASGSLVSGRLALQPVAGGVRIHGEVGGLSPGSVHGFHIHQTGDCSAADASSAGGHFNPGAQPHGRAGAGPHHLGDLDNIRAGADGVAHVDAVARGAVLGGGAATDIAGRAIVVHAGADDYASQPSGDAGARVACGVIQATP